MVREEVLVIEAGRKLNALVGKEIFDKSIMYFSNEWQDRGISQNWDDGYRFYHPQLPSGREFEDYSTDISAAWQVVEKMFKDGWREQQFSRDHRTGIWEAKFGIIDAGFAESFSLPEAICKAALLAKLEGGKK